MAEICSSCFPGDCYWKTATCLSFCELISLDVEKFRALMIQQSPEVFDILVIYSSIDHDCRRPSTVRVRELLEDHGVNVAEFGREGRKSLEHLVEELNLCQSELVLTQGKVLRRVQLVRLRLLAIVDNHARALVELQNETWMRAPDQKLAKLPSRRVLRTQTVDQATQDLILNLGVPPELLEEKKLVVLAKSTHTETKASMSYPGLDTEYIIHESTMKVRSQALDRAEAIGLPQGRAFERDLPVSALACVTRQFFWPILVKMRLDAQQGDWAKTEETRRLSFHGEEREETALEFTLCAFEEKSDNFTQRAAASWFHWNVEILQPNGRKIFDDLLVQLHEEDGDELRVRLLHAQLASAMWEALLSCTDDLQMEASALLDLCSDDCTLCSMLARHLFSVHLTVRPEELDPYRIKRLLTLQESFAKAYCRLYQPSALWGPTSETAGDIRDLQANLQAHILKLANAAVQMGVLQQLIDSCDFHIDRAIAGIGPGIYPVPLVLPVLLSRLVCTLAMNGDSFVRRHVLMLVPAFLSVAESFAELVIARLEAEAANSSELLKASQAVLDATLAAIGLGLQDESRARVEATRPDRCRPVTIDEVC
eukprot:g6687.t1